jgi:hypothetical protein
MVEMLQQKPRCWLLGSVEGAARATADTLYEHGKETWLQYDDVANELSREVATSAPDTRGITRSLHALKTDGLQRFHIHLPQSAPGSVIAEDELKKPASHRIVFAMTGAQPGLFEWAEVKGPITVGEQDGIATAQGEAVNTGHRIAIPPYSMVAIELAGGIHHFHNIRGLSFHRHNEPGNAVGDNITLHTQQWHGAMPQWWTAAAPMLLQARPATFSEPQALQQFMEKSYSRLRDLVHDTSASMDVDTTVAAIAADAMQMAGDMPGAGYTTRNRPAASR